MLQKASAIAAAVEAESRVQQVQAGLRDQEEQANAAVKVTNHVHDLPLAVTAVIYHEGILRELAQ